MFSKIKRKIYLAKLGGVIFATVFLIMLGMMIFQQFQIADLKRSVEILENN